MRNRVPPAEALVPLRTKLAYGLGAVAFGIKDNGFQTFLLLFYNQVVGLPAAEVGLVIAVALVVDAFIDPLLGVMSDRTRSRLGRRHPWLYASALPIVLSWVALWNPPASSWSHAALLGWLFVTAVLARAAIATNEVPSFALAPEMSRDYHERTSIFSYRYLFGWVGGLGFLVLAYAYFLRPPVGAQTGPLGLQGFGWYGIAGAVMMGVTVLASAFGTQRIALERQPPPVPRKTVREEFAAIRETLSNRAFLVLLATGVFTYAAQGVSFAMSNYLLNFVWRLSPVDFILYSLVLFAGVVLAFLFVTGINRRLGKVRAAALLTALAATFLLTPIVLRFAGAIPRDPAESQLLTVAPFFLMSTALGVAAFMTAASMMSDVVEASEETTGRREEGLFFAGALFMQKCASGLGILTTGIILAVASFPTGAQPGAVPVEVLDRLTLVFALVYGLLQVMAIAVVLRFPFGQAEHDARVARLAAERR